MRVFFRPIQMRSDSLPAMTTQRFTFSPLVVTEHGTGFLDQATGELHKAFAVHVSPRPRCFFAVTEEQLRAFYLARATTHAELCGYYAGHGYKGD